MRRGKPEEGHGVDGRSKAERKRGEQRKGKDKRRMEVTTGEEK